MSSGRSPGGVSFSGSAPLYNVEPTPATTVKSFLDTLPNDQTQDPSLAMGHNVAFDKEILVQLCSEDNATAPKAWQSIRVRILTLTDKNELFNVRIELDSEDDLFFHYTCAIDRDDYPSFQKSQGLRVGFSELPNIISRMFSDCIRDPNVILAVVVVSEDGEKARLDVISNMDFKLVELVSIPFRRTEPQKVRDALTYRFKSMKSKTMIMAKRLDEIHNLLRIKSPSLLLRLSNPSAGGAAGPNGSFTTATSAPSPARSQAQPSPNKRLPF